MDSSFFIYKDLSFKQFLELLVQFYQKKDLHYVAVEGRKAGSKEFEFLGRYHSKDPEGINHDIDLYRKDGYEEVRATRLKDPYLFFEPSLDFPSESPEDVMSLYDDFLMQLEGAIFEFAILNPYLRLLFDNVCIRLAAPDAKTFEEAGLENGSQLSSNHLGYMELKDFIQAVTKIHLKDWIKFVFSHHPSLKSHTINEKILNQLHFDVKEGAYSRRIFYRRMQLVKVSHMNPQSREKTIKTEFSTRRLYLHLLDVEITL